MKINRVGFEPSLVLNLSLIDIDTNIASAQPTEL